MNNRFEALKDVSRIDHRIGIKKIIKMNLEGYAFILPWLIGFLAFMLYPLLMSLYYSFTKYSIVGNPEWIGLGNYLRIFLTDEKFWMSLKVTFYYVVFAVPLRLAAALALAMLFKKARPLTNFYRAAYYVPSILGGSVAISVVWRQLFGSKGAFNDILLSLGLINQRISWIGTPDTAIWTLILLAAWQFGSPMIVFLAGLKQIPKSLYEAAKIDGASKWQQFTRITIPLLTPVIFFNLLMQMVRLFLMFTQAFIITDGGPLDRTLVYALYLYRKGISFGHLGYGSALAWIILVILTVATIIIFKTSNKWVYYES
ncbi:sugar ABC transporter permease [Halocella sp. SP3-1]|uniref:carbohydrate ABC transporter permease n=1 Tax=Halocella sp. SP3-1 TaxID=2382161 RepID=UPI00197AEED3|nr:sugar ABC transporter permease [Halocella sp. SP3-1]